MRCYRAKTTPLIDLLRRSTFSRIHGELTEHHGIRPSVSREQYVRRLRDGIFLPRLSNYKIERHFAGGEVLYFLVNPARSAPYTMAIIDIDVQKKRGVGSAEGAGAFARHLRRTS